MKKQNNKSFINEAKRIHNEKYDYSYVRYAGSAKKVQIGCPKHGFFWQTPSQHLSGKGCPYCEKNKLTRTEFLELAKQLHDNKYTYDKCTYTHETSSSDYITITCKKHGDFLQKVGEHLQGKGCKKCERESKTISLKTSNDIFEIDENTNWYLVRIQYEIPDNGTKVTTWAEPFESRELAETFIQQFKLLIDLSDALIINTYVLEGIAYEKIRRLKNPENFFGNCA